MRKLTKEERIARLCSDWNNSALNSVGAFMQDRQDAREGPLVAALRLVALRGYCNSPVCDCMVCVAKRALAQYDALDAKPEPGLRALFANVREVEGLTPGTVILATSSENYIALKAAVEREEGKR